MRILRWPFLLVIGLLSGCKGCDQERVIGAKPNREACPTCVRASRDNPVMQGIMTLQTAAHENDPNREIAVRTSIGFAYQNFRMDSHVSGDDAKGAVGEVLAPMPSTLGVTEADARSPTRALGWELHGTELGYAISTINTVRRNRMGTSNVLAKGDPIKVDLDPTVMLVPLQVVRVLPADGNAPFAWNLAKFTRATYKKYFDDRPDLATFRKSEPGAPNVLSQHTVDPTALPWLVADEIWAQCGIQFRMITCPGSNEGCPDLRVTDSARIVATSCGGELTGAPEARANWTDALALPGMRHDLPVVTFTWLVQERNCNFAGALTKGSKVAMGYGPMSGTGGGSDLDLAHELGHVLGLEDFKGCVGDGRHLMCHDGSGSARILPEHCKVARGRAAEFVRRAWGVTVAP